MNRALNSNDWHRPEGWHVWSSKREAHIRVALTGPIREAELALQIKGLVPEGHTVMAKVSFANTHIGDIRLSNEFRNHLFIIPRQAMEHLSRAGEMIRIGLISISVDETRSPTDYGLGKDSRQLGVALNTIMIK